jgi:hypothetical protein
MPASQTRRTLILAALALVASALLLVVLLRAAPPAQAAQTPATAAAPSGGERWLHVKVDSADEQGERVRVNVPLSLARTVLNSVQKGKLDRGVVHIDHCHLDDVDVRGIVKALKSAQDGEYVTVEQKDETVRVSKQAGMLLVHVTGHGPAGQAPSDAEKPEHHRNHQNVDVRVPLEVADALFSGAPDELNVGAALDLLSRHESIELVSVKDGEQTVHVWMDTKTTQE